MNYNFSTVNERMHLSDLWKGIFNLKLAVIRVQCCTDGMVYFCLIADSH